MSVLQKLDGAKPVEDRNPFMQPGPAGHPPGASATHKVAVLDYFVFDSTSHGQAIGANFLVIESAVHQPGSTVFWGWFVNRAAQFVGDKGDGPRNEAVDFVSKLYGVTLDDAKRILREQLLSNPVQGNETNPAQPARGMMITAVVTNNPGGKQKRGGGVTKPYNSIQWITVPGQTQDAILQVRQHMDVVSPLRLRDAAPPTPQGYGAPHPAPVGYGQPPAQYPPPAQAAYGYPPPGYPAAPAPAAAPPMGLPPGFLKPPGT